MLVFWIIRAIVYPELLPIGILRTRDYAPHVVSPQPIKLAPSPLLTELMSETPHQHQW